mgnify:CR=1 FL=1
MSDALTRFHPQIEAWFHDELGSPTDVQEQSWPVIERGEHALITAPTGSGKTLTAFLWSINRCLVGDLEPGSTRVLYISPLKALNNDIQRNLVGPLGALRQRASDAGSPFPDIRAQTRSGDTDAGDHHRMLRQSPAGNTHHNP